MADVPAWTVVPPLRCYHRREESALGICGEPAVVERPGTQSIAAAVFCRDHAQPGDVPIAWPRLVRRVSVTVEVLFAAASGQYTAAHGEALARLEAAVERAGGVVNLHAVRSAIGRAVGPGAPGCGAAGEPPT